MCAISSLTSTFAISSPDEFLSAQDTHQKAMHRFARAFLLRCDHHLAAL